MSIENNIAARLTDLQAEYKKGEKMLADMEREANQIRESLLRISGGIQVLEELESIASQCELDVLDENPQ